MGQQFGVECAPAGFGLGRTPVGRCRRGGTSCWLTSTTRGCSCAARRADSPYYSSAPALSGIPFGSGRSLSTWFENATPRVVWQKARGVKNGSVTNNGGRDFIGALLRHKTDEPTRPGSDGVAGLPRRSVERTAGIGGKDSEGNRIKMAFGRRGLGPGVGRFTQEKISGTPKARGVRGHTEGSNPVDIFSAVLQAPGTKTRKRQVRKN